MHGWRVFPLLGLCLLVTAGCGGSSPAKAQPSLSSLALRLSDLPSQTTPDTARFWTNAQAARRDGVPAATYSRHGRVQSYQDSFLRHVLNGSGNIWLINASNEVTAFRDAAGAHWYFDRVLAAMAKDYVTSTNNIGANTGQTGIPIYFRRLAVPAVGDEHAAFTADSGGDEMGYTTRVVLFRRGRYAVILHVRGLVDQTHISEVMAVARKIDTRVKAAA